MDSRIKQVLEHPWTVPAGAGVIGLCVGFGTGYFLGKRQQKMQHELPQQLSFEFDVHDFPKDESEYENEPEELLEIPKALPHGFVISEEEYESIQTMRDQAYSQREELAEQLEEAMTHGPEEPEITTIFADEEEDWDYDVEVTNRNEKRGLPYVIHRDEFWSEEMDYLQSTLYYYEGDDILVDDDNAPVYNHKDIVGELKFGHGSKDPNIVFVRNDRLRAEYEIVRHTGSYSREILGLEIEDNMRSKDLKHSLHKFKME